MGVWQGEAGGEQEHGRCGEVDRQRDRGKWKKKKIKVECRAYENRRLEKPSGTSPVHGRAWPVF